MTTPRRLIPIIALIAVTAFAATPTLADEAAAVMAEEQGLEGAATPSDPVGARTIDLRERRVDLLLIPDSTNDRVMAFDPVTGALVDADFIPADPTNLSTPKSALYKSDGLGFLVVDQLDDAVQEYDLTGAYVGIFAPAGGVNTAIMDNCRSIDYHPATGNLLVSVASGANADAIAEFDPGSGAYLGNFIANGAGGMNGPWDVLFSATEAFVSASDSDAVHRYNATTGAYIGDLISVDSFPEQLAWASNGNMLIAEWSGTQEGIIEVQLDGTVVGTYYTAEIDGPRGVFELPNGNLLVSNGDGVHEITRASTFVDSKITGVSCHQINLAPGWCPSSCRASRSTDSRVVGPNDSPCSLRRILPPGPPSGWRCSARHRRVHGSGHRVVPGVGDRSPTVDSRGHGGEIHRLSGSSATSDTKGLDDPREQTDEPLAEFEI